MQLHDIPPSGLGQYDGTVRSYRVLPLKAVVDDRICDGYTYSVAFKTMRQCFAHPEMLLEDRKIGGWGIFLVKKNVDEVTYAYENGKNVLTIRKNIS